MSLRRRHTSGLHSLSANMLTLGHSPYLVHSVGVGLCAVAAAGALASSGCAGDHPVGASRPFPAVTGRGPCAITKETDVSATNRPRVAAYGRPTSRIRAAAPSRPTRT